MNTAEKSGKPVLRNWWRRGEKKEGKRGGLPFRSAEKEIRQRCMGGKIQAKVLGAGRTGWVESTKGRFGGGAQKERWNGPWEEERK